MPEVYHSFNVWFDANPKVRKYLETDFEVSHPNDLKQVYLEQYEYGQHQAMELVMKMYALLKGLELNTKFRGFMKKKTEDMKRHYFMQQNVSALCTNDEIDIFKDRYYKGVNEPTPEELTIYCFITDVCQSVEILNKSGEQIFVYYPMMPKVYFLTDNSMVNFRAECRIDQATTKVTDLMAYVEQFDIEMVVNYELNEKYNLMSKLLSDDSFDINKKVLWVIGILINIGVVYYYRLVDGELICPEEYSTADTVIKTLSFIQLTWSFIIINLWFTFRYDSIRKIEREKFLIKDPDMNPNLIGNWLSIAIYKSILCQPAALNFSLHFIFTILSYTTAPVFFS